MGELDNNRGACDIWFLKWKSTYVYVYISFSMALLLLVSLDII